jgi:hypothetical protein
MVLAERRHIMHAVAFTKGEVRSRRRCGGDARIETSTLRSRMQKHGITRAAALLVGLPSVLPNDWSMATMQRRHIADVLTATAGRIEGLGELERHRALHRADRKRPGPDATRYSGVGDMQTQTWALSR